MKFNGISFIKQLRGCYASGKQTDGRVTGRWNPLFYIRLRQSLITNSERNISCVFLILMSLDFTFICKLPSLARASTPSDINVHKEVMSDYIAWFLN